MAILHLFRNQQNQNRRGRASHLLPKGVYRTASGKYAAQIKVNGVKHYLGVFYTPEQAHAAYCNKSRQLHGDFSNLKAI